MTNRNSNWRTERTAGCPFLLKPAGKDYLWGGTRLNDDFSKGIDMSPLAETWECSTHPDGLSVVASGEYEGRTLREVLMENPAYMCEKHAAKKGELPILIKFIDAKSDLSVQVHPNDEYAREHENGSLGKSEMWYVLDAQKGTEIVYGFRRDMDIETLLQGLKAGTIERYLQRMPIQKDDMFYIPAGQVHAIGAGALIAEIQESSNLTYRLYDYNRLDKDGKPRPLHIDKAVRVANLRGGEELRQPMRVLKFKRGYATELLCRCKYFQTERMLLNTERWRDGAEFQTRDDSFQVLLCTEGVGTLAGRAEGIPGASRICNLTGKKPPD
ncbi:MAG: class I mannose-6-phosphate isomerase, partial [Acetatifactor sp.]|nr:class I mannose-6-phosphate isomerase [Acetatifactor sp.]